MFFSFLPSLAGCCYRGGPYPRALGLGLSGVKLDSDGWCGWLAVWADRSVGLAASWFGRWYPIVNNYWVTSLGGQVLVRLQFLVEFGRKA